MFRSLERRISLIFVGLLALVMLITLLIVARGGESLITEESRQQLAAGAANFGSLIEREQRQLEIAAKVLTGDFSFREAIATQDRGTVLSVLRNHGLRIGAKVMMVVALDGTVMVDTQHPGQAPRAFPFPDLLEKAQQHGISGGITRMADSRYYQVVLLHILAPTRIAWVAIGFPIEDDWAAEHARVSGLGVSIVTQTGEVVASSLEAAARQELGSVQIGTDQDQARKIRLAGRNYHVLAREFGDGARVMLTRSLQAGEALFRDLEQVLVLIALGGILLFAVGSMIVARRIAGPVNELALASQRMATGDYSQAITIETGDEIGQLAHGFEHMRNEISSREHKIMRLAYEDTLTGLPNRTRLAEYVDRMDQSARAMVAVLDLDRFAPINDALGHTIGDRLLQLVAQRLAGILPAQGMLARLWGDEFAFVIIDADAVAVKTFSDRVQAALDCPFVIDGQRLDVSGSLGIAFRPADGLEMDSLLQRAELAMFAAKKRQCGLMFAYDVGAGPSPENLSLIGEMRSALENDEFVLHFQPKLALAENRVTGVEALLRWRHPARGLVPPSSFIPFAEQTGFIRQVTPWLLRQVAAQAAGWRERGIPVMISANLSARDLLNPTLVPLMSELLALHELSPSALCLEITESALMEDPALALSHLVELAALGLKLSIDDYGAGQASLAYIKSLPVHELKIDQSFIGSLASSPKDAAIVRSTIALGHALGLSVVAEGIESAADLEWLAQAGCDIGQGYFIARPLAVDDFENWYSRYRGAGT